MHINDDACLSAGSLQRTCKLQIQEERFKFTPVKVSTSIPRVWERKPSTSFLARSKSRKVWKRFRSSFNSMKALQQLIDASHDNFDDELDEEINVSRNMGYVRGVKRRCFTLGDSENTCLNAGKTVRGRSFLETKWESEATGRRRKLPNYSSPEPMEVDDQEMEDELNDVADQEGSRDSSTSMAEVPQDSDESLTLTPTRLVRTSAYPRALHGNSGDLCSTVDENDLDINVSDSIDKAGSEHDSSLHITGPTDDICMTTVQETAGEKSTAAPVQDSTAAQESKLVRSALRSSLDGEDAELLNNFLSKAKAKRAAKAAAMSAQDTEEAKLSDEEEELVTDLPTPQSRRVLVELDANSPSPSKLQLSPTKAADPHSSPVGNNQAKQNDDNNNDEDNGKNQQPASPVRRSTRTRTVKLPARPTLSLRRAKGTEFVFLQRTEAQELALATRRNTRQNKGDSLMPKYVLKALAKKSKESKTPNDDKSTRKGAATKKWVSWNEERLVEYEGGGGEQPKNDVDSAGGKRRLKSSDKKKAASGRTTLSQVSSKAEGDSDTAASTSAPATASSPKVQLRLRRPGASKANSTPVATLSASSSTSLSLTSSSPIGQRKTLTPKSPKIALLGTPTSKIPYSNSTDNSKTAVSSSSSGGVKTRNIFKAHAGSTPMPRRIRSRP